MTMRHSYPRLYQKQIRLGRPRLVGVIPLVLVVLLASGCYPRSRQSQRGSAGRHSNHSTFRGTSWTPSGSGVATFIANEEHRVLLFELAPRSTVVLVSGTDAESLHASAWAPRTDELCYATLHVSIPPRPTPRVLRIVDTAGNILHSADIPLGFVEADLAWTNDGRRLALADGVPHSGSVIRIFSHNLQPETQFEVDFSVISLQWNPTDAKRLIIQADRQHRGDLFDLNLETGALKRITTGAKIIPDASAWHCSPSGRMYFWCGGQVRPPLMSGSLGSYDMKSHKITTIISLDDVSLRQIG